MDQSPIERTLNLLVLADCPEDGQVIVEMLSQQGRTFCETELRFDTNLHNIEPARYDAIIAKLATHPPSFSNALQQTAIIGVVEDEKTFKKNGGGISEIIDKDHLTPWNLKKAIQYAIERRKLLKTIYSQEAALSHIIQHDTLTRLPNRVGFLARLKRAVARAERYGRSMGLLCIDVDNFKTINDSLGHEVGDEVLQIVATRLIDAIRENDSAVRLGGDEFAIILDEIDESIGAGVAAERIMEAIQTPLEIEQHKIFLTLSIGIATYPDNGHTEIELTQNADLALYQAKETGRSLYRFHSQDMNTKLTAYLDIKNALYDALEKEELFVHYQPKFNLVNNKIVGLEALLRWQRDKHGLTAPGDFIPVAEKVGLILPIGYWLIDSICQDIKHWDNLGMATPVAINLSARQLLDKNFISTVKGILEKYNTEPKFIEFELTESVVMSDPIKSLSILQQLEAMGLGLAIDDFGTGYSSLNYLKLLPVNTLKIDRSFVRDICDNDNDKIIVKSIIHLGKSLNIQVVAEGIENQEQLDILNNLDCKEGQGFFLCRPNNLETITEYMRKSSQSAL